LYATETAAMPDPWSFPVTRLASLSAACRSPSAVARALLLCSGPSQPVTVRLADQRERQLSPVELDRIRRAIPEAREALAVEAEGDADVENDRLAAELGLA
jgi:hypothetical protein